MIFIIEAYISSRLNLLLFFIKSWNSLIEGRIVNPNQEDTQITRHLNKAKFPMDLRIATYLLFAIGFFQLLLGVLLITGVGHTKGYTRRVLCGTVLITTDTAWAAYMLCGGLAHVLCAWGLLRKEKLGWWGSFLLSIYYLIEGMLLLPNHALTVSIGTIINIGIVTCLWFRRNVYDIELEANMNRGT